LQVLLGRRFGQLAGSSNQNSQFSVDVWRRPNGDEQSGEENSRAAERIRRSPGPTWGDVTRRGYFGCVFGSPPGVPGGGTTLR
jgi:hypothetical protein